MNPFEQNHQFNTRRQFFGQTATGIGVAALSSLLGRDLVADETATTKTESIDGLGLHHKGKAKRVIYLMMSGGPSHIDMFDYKPTLYEKNGEQLPDSVRQGQRLTTMTSNQKQLPVLQPHKPFQEYGRSRMMLSTMIPYTGSIADDICLVKSMNTEAINHAPAATFFLTGSQIPGRPSMGAWLSYGLGSLNDNLPSFVVMNSRDRQLSCGQLLYDYYWGSGFIPSQHQGVQFRAAGDPVLYLSNPPGMPRHLRRKMLDRLAELNQEKLQEFGDPEIETRIKQYEMAYRMQASVPELVDISDEPDHVLDMYGDDVKRPGSFARHCLMARRLAEKDVRFIQLMHIGWDQHANIPSQLEIQCKDTDQPAAALVKDLKQRGLLEDTLVIFGGEFGRTTFAQGDIRGNRYGRDHHGRVFSLWMAGGGLKSGFQYGESCPYGWNVAKNGVHVHDWQATVLHLLGINHELLTYRYQGRRFRLTDVHGHVVDDLIA
ncbi:MAG: DUF1501 domain-containing protein [Planctomycetota bacterium]